MTAYMVRRYEDHLGQVDNGVDDTYLLVGVYSTKEQAVYALDHLDEQEKPFCGEEIIEIDIDHTYSAETGPWLGGGYYLE